VSTPEQHFVVRYVAGSISGKRSVWAQDEAQALERVRRQVRSEVSQYPDSYAIEREPA
jgi:hypothetical protein